MTSQMSTTPAQREQDTNLWSEIFDLQARANDLNQQPRQLVPLMSNPEINARLPNEAETRQLASILLRDVQEFDARLQSIHNDLAAATSRKQARDSAHMASIDIGEKYLAWIDAFQNVVIPVFSQVLLAYSAASRAPAATEEAAVAVAGL